MDREAGVQAVCDRATPLMDKHLMKAIETTATINDLGQLTLDTPLDLAKARRVRVIVLISEDDEIDPDDTPTEVALEGIRQGLHEAFTGQTIPLSQMWDGIDAD
jgi:hypothetical protein